MRNIVTCIFTNSRLQSREFRNNAYDIENNALWSDFVLCRPFFMLKQYKAP